MRPKPGTESMSFIVVFEFAFPEGSAVTPDRSIHQTRPPGT